MNTLLFKDREPSRDPALLEELRRYREQHADMIQCYKTITEQIKKKNIDSFEALAEHDKAVAIALIELTRKTQPISIIGNNISLFGLTSTGSGETTIEIASYQGTNFVLWDIPGRNDESTYLSMQYIAFWKGLTKRLILITTTIKENTSMMKLLDAIGLHYDIVVNKFDNVEEDEQKQFRAKIEQEVKDIGLKCVDHVFFVRAKHPNMFPDWQTIVNYLFLFDLIVYFYLTIT